MRLSFAGNCTKCAVRYAVPALAVAAIAAGCASNKKDTMSYRGVTEISPAPQAAPAVAYQPSYQPYQSATPAASAQPINDATYAAPSASAGGTYTVQRGDTLYKIAREHYGDGKAWQKIAAANPTAANGAIKPGQKLILP